MKHFVFSASAVHLKPRLKWLVPGRKRRGAPSRRRQGRRPIARARRHSCFEFASNSRPKARSCRRSVRHSAICAAAGHCALCESCGGVLRCRRPRRVEPHAVGKLDPAGRIAGRRGTERTRSGESSTVARHSCLCCHRASCRMQGHSQRITSSAPPRISQLHPQLLARYRSRRAPSHDMYCAGTRCPCRVGISMC